MSPAPKEVNGAGGRRRTSLPLQDSNSIPSTPPISHARTMDTSYRTPSPRLHGVNQSPRSVSSESNRGTRNVRTTSDKCRFMTSQTARRRIPYSIGSEPLPSADKNVKEELTPQEDKKITKEIQDLYNQLLPSDISNAKRDQLVQKLQTILKEDFPGKETRVTVFGSSANLLCTSKSDVDICISMKELETPCLLAEILSKRGMQNVKCVHARSVPIVKIWDPELQLACDLNVNNLVALKNTQLVKAYMELDPRVRQLALIIKHWAKRRVLNEASGGALSSYTWTLLVINFLQCRQPPVLPVISVADNKNRHKDDFSVDVKENMDFGTANSESLGTLLFKFFRRYGFEIDYDISVMSVREGRILSKMDKNWYFSNNNRFCVEEPFNTDRNLGNTADDTAVRGIHLELRQAFDRVAGAKSISASVCEPYEFPKEEPKPVIEKVPSQPAVLARSNSQSGQGNRNNRSGSGRGNGRNNNPNSHRNAGSGGRRASSAAAYGQMYPSILPGPAFMFPAARFGPGYAFPAQQLQPTPEQLRQQMQALSTEEQTLRFKQLMLSKRHLEQTASQIRAANSGTMGSYVGGVQGFPSNPQRRMQGNDINSTQGFGHQRVGGMDDVPATAPLISGQMYSSQYSSPVSMSLSSSQQGTNTNPSSPSLGQNIPLRRGYQRTPTQNSPNGSLRSHSQPARTMTAPTLAPYPTRPQFGAAIMTPAQPGQIEMPYYGPPQAAYGQQFVDLYGNFYYQRRAPEPVVRREYLGYGIGGSPQSATMLPDSSLPRIPNFGDLQRQSYHASPSRGPMLSNHNIPLEPSRSPSPLGIYGNDGTEEFLNGTSQFDRGIRQYSDSVTDQRPVDSAVPMIVNGSNQSNATLLNASQSHDIQRRRVSDIGTYSSQNRDMFWDIGRPQQFDQLPPPFDQEPDRILQHPQEIQSIDSRNKESGMSSQIPTRSEPPVPQISPAPARKTKSPSKPLSPNPPEATEPGKSSNSTRASPDRGQAGPSRASNGTRNPTSPLDLLTKGVDKSRDGTLNSAPLLSPVHETRTPSPSSNRKTERRAESQINGANGTNVGAHPNDSLQSTSFRSREVQNGSGRTGNTVTSSAPLTSSSQVNVNSNPWQQAGRKGKKGRTASLQLDTSASRSRGEPLPANIAERKGG